MASQKPTVILIPGAWHLPAPYAPLLQALEALGHTTISKKLPSVIDSETKDENIASLTLANDVSFFRENTLLPELEKNNVILVGHSYGGMVCGAAAHGLGKGESPAAHSVLGLVYLCAVVGITDKPMLEGPKQLAPWISDLDAPRLSIPDPAGTFYELLPEEERNAAATVVQEHALPAFLTPSPPQAYTSDAFQGRFVYVRCHKDLAIPLVVQDVLRTATGSDNWILEDLEEAGHSPFLTHKEETVAIIEKHIKQWT
jgi:pimeloyl-ACP methyl ester carboxylesterase